MSQVCSRLRLSESVAKRAGESSAGVAATPHAPHPRLSNQVLANPPAPGARVVVVPSPAPKGATLGASWARPHCPGGRGRPGQRSRPTRARRWQTTFALAAGVSTSLRMETRSLPKLAGSERGRCASTRFICVFYTHAPCVSGSLFRLKVESTRPTVLAHRSLPATQWPQHRTSPCARSAAKPLTTSSRHTLRCRAWGR